MQSRILLACTSSNGTDDGALAVGSHRLPFHQVQLQHGQWTTVPWHYRSCLLTPMTAAAVAAGWIMVPWHCWPCLLAQGSTSRSGGTDDSALASPAMLACSHDGGCSVGSIIGSVATNGVSDSSVDDDALALSAMFTCLRNDVFWRWLGRWLLGSACHMTVSSHCRLFLCNVESWRQHRQQGLGIAARVILLGCVCCVGL